MDPINVNLFKSAGFRRVKCSSCGNFFWTLGSDDICGDPPCAEYSFIGQKTMNKKYSLSEMREAFLSFLEKNGHTRVSRYPVVARWRDDIYYTIASIACFQPWVLNGSAEPPANPLAISQPCIRFTDIDNVGKTGRHLTLFEMMAHHVFNNKKKEIYFKDKTVELCHSFLTGTLKIDPKIIKYKESWWEGGGNAGQCLEVLIRGAEVATLVFMEFEGPVNGKYTPMSMKVVDTGYGLERLVWVSQGTPSAYDALFPEVVSFLRKSAGLVKVDERVLSEYSKVAGMMSIDTAKDLRALRASVAKRLGISSAELEAIIAPWEFLYSIADHTKTMAFMLSDGVVPSNVKEGYLARLVIRRALRAMKALGVSCSLEEIVALHIDSLKKDFPELSKNKESIFRILAVEEAKFRKTLEGGERLVSRLVDELKKKGAKSIPLSDLIELYDSQGLPPSEVREFAKGIEVDIPDDFYVQVAARHSKAAREEKSAEPKSRLDFKPTELLYYSSRESEFDAKVLGVVDSSVVLDRTLFYPEGGGQPSDLGILDGRKVLDVKKAGDVVLHKLDNVKDLGKKVHGSIDPARRTILTQMHSATHVINGAARKILGEHVWQAGAQKGVDKSRLDITHFEGIDAQTMGKIESLANKIVADNIPIEVTWLPRKDAEAKYGFRLYQGGAVPGRDIRVVKMGDFDVEACGGMQCSSTGEIGIIKLIKSERIQDGVVRITFAAGPSALSMISKQEALLHEASGVFSVQPEALPATAKRFFVEWTGQRKEIARLQDSLAELRGESLLSRAEHLDGFKLISQFYPSASFAELGRLADVLTEGERSVVLLGSVEGKLIGASSSGLDMAALFQGAAASLGGRSGGRPERAVMSIQPDKVEKAVSFCADLVRKKNK